MGDKVFKDPEEVFTDLVFDSDRGTRGGKIRIDAKTKTGGHVELWVKKSDYDKHIASIVFKE